MLSCGRKTTWIKSVVVYTDVRKVEIGSEPQFIVFPENLDHSSAAKSVNIISIKGSGSVVKTQQNDNQLITFLQEELDISAKSIAFALRHSQQDPGPLPMILWQYGLVSIEQLEQIFDWLEG